jgi:hypothetical protein
MEIKIETSSLMRAPPLCGNDGCHIAAVTIKVNTIGEQRVSARAIPDYYFIIFFLWVYY